MTRDPEIRPQLATSFTGCHTTVYLLHFEQDLFGRRHYIGITTTSRIGARMVEHAAGRGSAFTRAMARRNNHFRLVRVWTNSHPGLERQLKKAGHYDRNCPICAQAKEPGRYPAKPTTYDPEKEAVKLMLLDRLKFPTARGN